MMGLNLIAFCISALITSGGLTVQIIMSTTIAAQCEFRCTGIGTIVYKGRFS